MNPRESHATAHPATERGSTPATGQVPGSRWPGALMVLLMLLAVVWPVGGLAAGAIAYLSADRDQGTALLGVAAAALLLRWAFGG